MSSFGESKNGLITHTSKDGVLSSNPLQLASEINKLSMIGGKKKSKKGSKKSSSKKSSKKRSLKRAQPKADDFLSNAMMFGGGMNPALQAYREIVDSVKKGIEDHGIKLEGIVVLNKFVGHLVKEFKEKGMKDYKAMHKPVMEKFEKMSKDQIKSKLESLTKEYAQERKERKAEKQKEKEEMKEIARAYKKAMKKSSSKKSSTKSSKKSSKKKSKKSRK